VGGIFDGQLALRQLRYAGLFEAIRIRKSGYAYRATFRVFANSYQILVDGMTKKRESNSLGDQDCCRAILAQVTAGEFTRRALRQRQCQVRYCEFYRRCGWYESGLVL
jgi:myosin heavy subunit